MPKFVRKKYPTDLSPAQWHRISHFFRRRSRRGRPRTHNYREVVNAILYFLKAGCPWRLLPHDLPRWDAVYQLFYRWRKSGLWRRIHRVLQRELRRNAGKQPTPSVGILDSQSVKTTHIAGAERGYDNGKQVKGRKRHIAVDTLGLLMGVDVNSAAEQDYSGSIDLIHQLCLEYSRLGVLFADSAYGKMKLPEMVKGTLGVEMEIVKRSGEVKRFEVQPKRWIVERTFAWLNLSRRHSKDYELNPETSEELIIISMIHLMLKRLEPA